MAEYSVKELCYTTDEARAYAGHVWDQTLCQELHAMSAFHGIEIMRQVEEGRRHNTVIQASYPGYCAWKEDFDKKQKDSTTELVRFANEGTPIVAAYHQSRMINHQAVMDRPNYAIDPMKTKAALEIQRSFDVEREARHLSSHIYEALGIQLLKALPGRCVYLGSVHITAEISIAAEIEFIDKLGKDESQRPGDIIPVWLADLLDWQLNGNKTGYSWTQHQRYLNSTTLEKAVDSPGMILPSYAFITRRTDSTASNETLDQMECDSIPNASAPAVVSSFDIQAGVPTSVNSNAGSSTTEFAPSAPSKPKDQKYKDVRGPPPNGMTEDQWNDAYNNADTRIGRKSRAKTARKISRDNGATRKNAIARLKAQFKGQPHWDNFVDDWEKR